MRFVKNGGKVFGGANDVIQFTDGANDVIQFTDLQEGCTIGKFGDRSMQRLWTKRYIRAGGLSVELLKKFIELLEDGAVIGVYVDRKDFSLVPLHCKGFLCAPRENGFADMNLEYY